MAASKTHDLFMLVLKSPVSDYEKVTIKTDEELKGWKEKGHTYYESGKGEKLKLNYTFFEDFKNNDAYKAAKKIRIPTLIVHGDKDETVPLEQSKKTSGLIENCKLEIIEGSDHRYTNPEHFEKMIKLVSEFIINHV